MKETQIFLEEKRRLSRAGIKKLKKRPFSDELFFSPYSLAAEMQTP